MVTSFTVRTSTFKSHFLLLKGILSVGNNIGTKNCIFSLKCVLNIVRYLKVLEFKNEKLSYKESIFYSVNLEDKWTGG